MHMKRPVAAAIHEDEKTPRIDDFDDYTNFLVSAQSQLHEFRDFGNFTTFERSSLHR